MALDSSLQPTVAPSELRGKAKKEHLLGMSFGKANARLRKALLFSLVVRLNEDFCHRCGGRIMHINEFSIEHKDSWQLSQTPTKTFFDLGNIAFSHFSCNISAATKTNKTYPSEGIRRRARTKRQMKTRIERGEEYLAHRRNVRQKQKARVAQLNRAVVS